MFSSHQLGIRVTEPKTAVIVGSTWRIMTSPDKLPFGADCQLDHVDRVVWLSPFLPVGRRPSVLTDAFERAATESLALLRSTEQTT